MERLQFPDSSAACSLAAYRPDLVASMAGMQVACRTTGNMR